MDLMCTVCNNCGEFFEDCNCGDFECESPEKPDGCEENNATPYVKGFMKGSGIDKSEVMSILIARGLENIEDNQDFHEGVEDGIIYLM